MSIWALGADAADELAAALVGAEVRKAIDPLTPQGFLVISDRVAAALTTVAQGAEALVVQKVLKELDLDWDTLSNEALQLAVTAANEGAAKHYASKVLPKVDEVLEIEGPRLMMQSRASVIAREKIEILSDLAARDLDAESAIRRSHVNFVRDATGKRIDRAGSAARDIVARGLEQGIGRKVIGAELRKHFASTIPRPQSYWNVVASAYIGRARSTSQIYAYEDAQIESFEVVAVIDEATTDQCRYMNGKVFSVRRARALLEKLNSLQEPDDVRYVNPWIRKGKDASGGQRLFIQHADGSTTTIAKVTRSGVGTADDKGEFAQGKTAGSMSRLGVQFPPYHGHCRTMIVATSESERDSSDVVVAEEM